MAYSSLSDGSSVKGCNLSHINVSVIVPVYKVEEFLVRCLDSLCVQNLENIEFY